MSMITEQVQTALTIRAMRKDDAEAVAQLTAQLGYERSPGEIGDWIARLAQREDQQAAFVACLGEEVVGWIEISIERRLQSPEFGLIGGLVVSQGHRSGGIGRRLCERAEAWSREHGLTRLRVTSRSTRADAHRFYLRDGYEVMKTSMVFEKKLP